MEVSTSSRAGPQDYTARRRSLEAAPRKEARERGVGPQGLACLLLAVLPGGVP